MKEFLKEYCSYYAYPIFSASGSNGGSGSSGGDFDYGNDDDRPW